MYYVCGDMNLKKTEHKYFTFAAPALGQKCIESIFTITLFIWGSTKTVNDGYKMCHH